MKIPAAGARRSGVDNSARPLADHYTCPITEGGRRVADDECALLSALLLDGTAIRVARDALRPVDFAQQAHRLVFEAACAVDDNGGLVDPHSMLAELATRGTLGTVGGKEFLLELVDYVPTPANVAYYARIVREHSVRRQLAPVLSSLLRELEAGSVRPTDVARELASLGSAAELQTARHYRLLSAWDLDQLPPQGWIVDKAIPQNGLIGWIGAKGTLKTFTALDLALHVAAGRAWHGRAVIQCPVLYVYAEGPFGARARLDAWCSYQTLVIGTPIDRRSLPIWFLPSRVPINDPRAVAGLVAEIRRLSVVPRLIVIDTVNQNLDGDEDGTGMGGFVAGCARLRQELDSSVIAVHHTPIGADDRPRGHSSLDGAFDTRIIIRRDDERVSIKCAHQRNGPDDWSVSVETIAIAGSLALKAIGPSDGDLRGHRRTLLELVHRQGQLSFTKWKEAAKKAGISSSSFKNSRTWLIDRAYVKLDNSKYSTTEAGAVAIRASRTLEGQHVQVSRGEQ
jgi:hypothetical protein